MIAYHGFETQLRVREWDATPIKVDISPLGFCMRPFEGRTGPMEREYISLWVVAGYLEMQCIPYIDTPPPDISSCYFNPGYLMDHFNMEMGHNSGRHLDGCTGWIGYCPIIMQNRGEGGPYRGNYGYDRHLL